MSISVLSKDQLASIGTVAVQCTQLDLIVEVSIWTSCGLNFDQGKFFTTMMQLDRKLDLLSDLGKQKLPPEKIPEFAQIISDCKLANNDRNTIIHGLWTSTEVGLAAILTPEDKRKPAIAVKRRLRSEAQTFSADKVNSVAERLSDVTARLFKFVSENGLFA